VLSNGSDRSHCFKRVSVDPVKMKGSLGWILKVVISDSCAFFVNFRRIFWCRQNCLMERSSETVTRKSDSGLMAIALREPRWTWPQFLISFL
jgi:hypothetical protein